MSLATLKQGVKFLDMIVEEGVPNKQLRWALKSGAISDILKANPKYFDRDAFREFLGLKPLNPPMSIVVDCDASPEVVSGESWLTGEGTEHRKMGKVTLEKRDDGKLYANGEEVVRHLSPNQQDGIIRGQELRNELKDVRVLNACILDVLFANPQLIPEAWKKGITFFWGTIFRNVDGDLLVGCLRWDGGRWDRYYDWFDKGWNDNEPAASLASQSLGTGAVITF